MTQRPWRVAYLVTHPIQYQAPLLRHISASDSIDLTVFFQSDVSLRAYEDRGFGQKVEWDVPLLDGYRHVFLPSVLSSSGISPLRPFSIGLKKHLVEGRFDALWVHGYARQVHLRAMRIARSLGIKVLLRGESLLAPGREGPVWGPIKERFLTHLFKRVDGFLAIGERNRAFYRHHGVSDERIFKMPYAVDNAFFRERARRAEAGRETLRSELGLDPQRPVILYASKFMRRKRPDDLIAAYARLSPEAPRTDGDRPDQRPEPRPYLLMVGDGEMRPELEAAAGRLGWDSIRFLGFKNQTELPALFDLCDVFCLPSDYEPWGLVVNEVMNAGRPVITSEEVGSTVDLVEDGVTGFTFPAGSVAGLASALMRATEDREKTRKLGEAARERIRGWDFDADRDGLVNALEALVGRAA